MLDQNIGPMSDTVTENSSTNRPVIDDDTSKLLGQQHDMSSGGFTNYLRRRLRHIDHSPIDTTYSGPSNPVRYHSSSTLSDTSSSRIRMSPPRTVPFVITSEQLQGTPIREQVLMLTENRLRSLGAHTDSDTDSGPFSIGRSESSRFTTRPGKKRVNEEDDHRDRTKFDRKLWEMSNMDSDDTDGRENLVKFLKGRNVQFKQPYLPGTTANKRFRPEIEVEQDLIGSNRSSSSRSEQAQEEEEEAAVVSPLSSSRQQENIRFSPRFLSEETIQSPRYRSEEIQSPPRYRPEAIQSPPRFQGTESSISPRFQAVTPLAMQEQEVEAYEFSDGLLPYGSAYNEIRMHTTDTTTNSTTSRQSITSTSSSIPRKFELKYFTEKFRNPPNSLKLTKIYNEFNKRPGTLLTIEDVMNYLDDTSFTIEFVSLSIGILTRKRFLRMVGDKGDAWVIRR